MVDGSDGRSPDSAAESRARDEMVRTQIEARGVNDRRVLEAMRRVPRHLFVPPSLRPSAYDDRPLPIGHGQTISQPYIVALMCELVTARDPRRVLEIGTGSGYQAAILALIVPEVVSVEIVPELARESAARLDALGFSNVRVVCGDAIEIAREQGPFDAIVAACAAPEVPPELLDALASAGRCVLPIGRGQQELVVVERDASGRLTRFSEGGVAFVPMTHAPRR